MVSKANLLHKLFPLTSDVASEGKEAKKKESNAMAPHRKNKTI